MNEIEEIRNSFSCLTVSQELIVKELLSNQLFAKHFNSFELNWTADDELAIARIAPNIERAIIIGEDDNDVYFVEFAGYPVKSKFLHLQGNNVAVSNLLDHFLVNLE